MNYLDSFAFQFSVLIAVTVIAAICIYKLIMSQSIHQIGNSENR
jgi:hypothetical protein